MSGIKIIKFDLPINGIKAKTVEELRDNLSDELVTLARSEQLARWLASRKHEEIAQAVAAAVVAESDDKALFLALCRALEVEVHPDDVAALFDLSPPGKKLGNSAGHEVTREVFEDLLRLNLKLSCVYPDPEDQELLCELVSRFDHHVNSQRKECVFLCKDFAWDPVLRVQAGDFLEAGDLIASVRNQKMIADVPGTVRAIRSEALRVVAVMAIDAGT